MDSYADVDMVFLSCNVLMYWLQHNLKPYIYGTTCALQGGPSHPHVWYSVVKLTLISGRRYQTITHLVTFLTSLPVSASVAAFLPFSASPPAPFCCPPPLPFSPAPLLPPDFLFCLLPPARSTPVRSLYLAFSSSSFCTAASTSACAQWLQK